MILHRAEVGYVSAVAEALASGELPPAELTSDCPECGQRITSEDNDFHVVVFDDEDDPNSPVAVVIGCEGFWLVDPSLVGIDAPNWQPYRDE